MNSHQQNNPLMAKVVFDKDTKQCYLKKIEDSNKKQNKNLQQNFPVTSLDTLQQEQVQKKSFQNSNYQTPLTSLNTLVTQQSIQNTFVSFQNAQNKSKTFQKLRGNRNKSRNYQKQQKSFYEKPQEKNQRIQKSKQDREIFQTTDYSDLVSNQDKQNGFFTKMKNQKQIRGFLFIGKQIKDQLIDIKFRIDKFQLYACDCEAIRLNEEMCNNIRYFLNYLEAPKREQLLDQYNSTLETNFFPPATVKQIQVDVVRTFSSQKYFQNQSQQQGFQQLERILKAISTFNQIGYVQGMNYIAASFLWHCHEEFGYFIIEELFSKLDVVENYNENLTGIQTHCNEFWEFLQQKDLTIYENLTDKGIPPILIFTEWFVTLGTSIIPLSHHLNMFQNLFENGWNYFYDILYNFLQVHFEDFKNLDTAEALMFLKQGHLLKKKWNQILKAN